MAFHPLGNHIEINSTLSVDQLKMAIQAKKKGLLDPKHGARGWIAGSIFCLWSDALGRNVPVVWGKMHEHGAGTRLRLRSTAAFSGILVPLGGLLGIGVGWLRYGPLDGMNPAWPLGLICALGMLGIWIANASRGDADELVKFVRDIAGQKKIPKRVRPDVQFEVKLDLVVDGRPIPGPISAKQLGSALDNLGGKGFLILKRDDQHYAQTATLGDYYQIEWRDGGDQQHFRAQHLMTGQEANLQPDDLFTADETFDVLCAFGTGKPAAVEVKWVPVPC